MNTPFTCFCIGENSLLRRCAEILLEKGHIVTGIVTPTPAISAWGASRGIAVYAPGQEMFGRMKDLSFDYLFSITNLSVLPKHVLALPRKGAVNFHDGPLPGYAGLHATTWAILNRERSHAVVWHLMEETVDTGDVLGEAEVAIDEYDTAFSLNLKCFEAGASSFAALVDRLAAGTSRGRAQDSGRRTCFPKLKRPDNVSLVDWNLEAAAVGAFVRALDFGMTANPFSLPRIVLDGRWYALERVEVTDTLSAAQPGAVTGIDDDSFTIATADVDLRIPALRSLDGTPRPIGELAANGILQTGRRLCGMDAAALNDLSNFYRATLRHERFWRDCLATSRLPDISDLRLLLQTDPDCVEMKEIILEIPEIVMERIRADGGEFSYVIAAAFGIFVCRHFQVTAGTLGFCRNGLFSPGPHWGDLFAETVPFTVAFDPQKPVAVEIAANVASLRSVVNAKTYLKDVFIRFPDLGNIPQCNGELPYSLSIMLSDGRTANPPPQSAITIVAAVCAPNPVKLIFNAAAIPQEQVAAFADRFVTFLQDALTDPAKTTGSVELLPRAEKNRILYEWNNTCRPFLRDVCIHRLIEERVRQVPDRTAAIDEAASISYRELDEKARALAAVLLENGVGFETPVGINLDRTVNLPVAVLAVWKAGGAYVPLDPDFPAERISYMVENSGCRVIISDGSPDSYAPPSGVTTVNIDRCGTVAGATLGKSGLTGETADNCAYVLYTSGSTGRPKGVVLTHRNVANFFTGMDELLNPSNGGTWLAVTSLSFDISVLELFWTLARGFTVVIYKSINRGGVLRSSTAGHRTIPELMEHYGVTHFQCTPSMARMLLSDAAFKKRLGHLSYCLIGGEAFPPDLARELKKYIRGTLLNMYGPTETTVWSTVHEVGMLDETVPIGRPIANTQVYLLDSCKKQVWPGAPGELYIGGEGVARGYFNRPDLTADRFSPDPFSDGGNGRMYATGDLARFGSDGILEFIGRIDHQIKVRGHRIEPGEIEASIVLFENIKECVVVAFEFAPGDTRLVAYIVPDSKVALDPGELQKHLSARLPDYMVPAHIVLIESMPLTPNRKIDRKALPRPVVQSPTGGSVFNASSDLLENNILAIWKSILGKDSIGLNDNFFDSGGHSLSAVQLLDKLRDELCKDIALIDIFRFPTIGSFAHYLGMKEDPGGVDKSKEILKRNRLSKQRIQQGKRYRTISMPSKDAK